MSKILHLISDGKITDNVIENFEKVFNNNIFFVLGDNDNRKYCKTVQDNVFVKKAEFFTKQNIDHEVVAVVIHGLNSVFAKLILNLNKNIKKAWFVWGYDIYNLPRIKNKIYSPKSLEYIQKHNSKFKIRTFIKNSKYLRRFYYKFINNTDDFSNVNEVAQTKINFFCTYIKEDFELYSKYYPNKLEYCEIGYLTINQYLAGQNDLRINNNAKDIIIGNSNSLENNHLDVFEIIKDSNFNERVFVPLSYGIDQKYKSVVLSRGKELFNDKFYPLLDFMERDKYFNLLSGCSAAVFYHYRQQAMGNILALLYMGVRIYLSPKNPVYEYLRRIGIVVFDFDTEFSLYSNSILEVEKQEVNRNILDKLFSQNTVTAQYIELINKLLNDPK